MARTITMAAGAESDNTLEPLPRAIFDLLCSQPMSTEPESVSPLERSRHIASIAKWKSAALSGSLALPPGPAGLLTVLPDLVGIWRIQQKMVADIAAAFGKSAFLTREAMMWCLFRHAAGQVIRDFVVRVGERVLVRRASLRVVQQVLRRVGISVTQRIVGRTISRWLPVIGAAGIAAYAYHDTGRVAEAAIELFQKDLMV